MDLPEILSRFIVPYGGITFVLGSILAYLGTISRNRIRDREAAKLRTDLERLKSELAVTQQQSTYMHQLRFNIEFKIYSELWPRLRAVRDACARMVYCDWPDQQRSQDELRGDLSAAVKALGDLVEDQRPFFSANIAEALFRLMEVTEAEAKRDAEFEKTRHDPDPRLKEDLEAKGMGDYYEAVKGGLERLKGFRLMHRHGVLNLHNIRTRCDYICELIRSRINGTAEPPPLADTEPFRAPSHTNRKHSSPVAADGSGQKP